jgi:1-acyl-sn-glycerol-3-phosphate acyltransferase
MKRFLRNMLRASRRLLRLAGEVLLALLDFVINVIFRPKLSLTRARSLWLQQACRRLLRTLNVKVATEGTIPLNGLLICSQFSFLDIFVISAITPAVFISRSEIKYLPLFGWFASLSGALFVRPSKKSDLARLNREFGQILNNGGLVVLFPEPVDPEKPNGPEPFRSALLEPAARLNQPLHAAAIRYAISDAAAGARPRQRTNVAPRLLSLLHTERVSVTVTFTRLEKHTGNRKELARRQRQYLEHTDESEARQPVA